MKSHELITESNKSKTRPGRGISAGRGKTAGRGTKGQNSRTGGKRRPGFEGGQNPIFQRLPKKRGFRSFKTAKSIITTGELEAIGETINNKALLEAGLIDDINESVKLIVKGDVKSKHLVELSAASESAIKLIDAAGGSFKSTN